MPRAFITGITGQDGSYLAEQMLALGWDVFGVGREDFPAESSAASSTSLHVDLVNVLDWTAMSNLLDEADPEVIFNLAGLSSVAQSWKEPELAMELNAGVPARLIEWIEARSTVGRPVNLVQASSAEIFGNAPTSLQDELTPIAPLNPYGESKAKAHQLVQRARERGIHASNAILYNHESPRRPTHFVTRKVTSAFARIAAGSRETLKLGNLDVRRDWGWAPDYVDAMYRMSQATQPNDFVIATGVAHSVRDLLSIACAAAGVDSWEPFVTADPDLFRPLDAPEYIGNPARALSELGWTATMDFQTLVSTMVEADAS